MLSTRIGSGRRRFLRLALVLTCASVPTTRYARGQAPAAIPDFGPNVLILDPHQAASEMQSTIDAVYAKQQHSEFGEGRYAILIKPGEYRLDIPVGFYTQVLGLGASPDSTHVTGNVHSDAALGNNNATTTFWRSVEGFSVTPTNGTLQWAVSQAVAFRRMHVLGDMVLHQNHGWASGGWISDSKIDGNVDSGSQQQWISRNTEWKSWTGSNWNMVFVGVRGTPPGDWPKPAYTKVPTTPVVREKPFLQIDSNGHYSVRVPALAHDSIGYTWRNGSTPGRDVPLDRFYIAHAGKDTSDSLNAALSAGKNLLLTPGIYDLTKPLRVTHKDSIVMGLGFATLHPTRGTAALTLPDEDGVIVCGLLLDAGEVKSPALLQVGVKHTDVHHFKDPISLHDIWFRDGGASIGKVDANLVVNSNNVIIDHTWIWRADHGQGVGWDSNLSKNGLVVNGDDVTAYGLFVEHHQQFQVLWNGERGRTYFYQSEIPYDPPDNLSWTSAPHQDGWASYKVNETVKAHEAWGLGVYSVFRRPNVTLSRAIEAPINVEVRFHHMVTVALDNLGEISRIIDNTGEAATTRKPRVDPRLNKFPTQ